MSLAGAYVTHIAQREGLHEDAVLTLIVGTFAGLEEAVTAAKASGRSEHPINVDLFLSVWQEARDILAATGL